MFQGYDIGVLALLTLASATDLRTGKIYNNLTFPFLFLGLGLHAYFGGFAGAGAACLVVGISFALFFPLYLVGVMAAGDVKLLMALGAWVSWQTLLQVAAFAVICGAFIGALLLFQKTGWRLAIIQLRDQMRSHRAISHGMKMPFAPAFLCSFLLVKVGEQYQWSLF